MLSFANNSTISVVTMAMRGRSNIMKCENMSWRQKELLFCEYHWRYHCLGMVDSGGYPAESCTNLVMDHSAVP